MGYLRSAVRGSSHGVGRPVPSSSVRETQEGDRGTRACTAMGAPPSPLGDARTLTRRGLQPQRRGSERSAAMAVPMASVDPRSSSESAASRIRASAVMAEAALATPAAVARTRTFARWLMPASISQLLQISCPICGEESCSDLFPRALTCDEWKRGCLARRLRLRSREAVAAKSEGSRKPQRRSRRRSGRGK